MCQIVSDDVQTSNFSCFCILVAAIRVFINHLYHGTVVALHARVASCGCANAFCGPTPALEFNFHDVIAEIGIVLRR